MSTARRVAFDGAARCGPHTSRCTFGPGRVLWCLSTRQQSWSSRRRSVAAQATDREDGQGTSTSTKQKPSFMMEPTTLDDRVRLRSEAEAPWRSLRFLFFGSSVASAGLALLFNIPQLIGTLAGAPNAMPRDEVLMNVAINATAAGVFAFLFAQDWKARDKQMARLGREETLSACGVRLANGKRLLLSQLRGSARIVVCAGTNAQVRAALEAAEPFKAELQRRGVLVVPLPIYEPEGGEPTAPPLEDPPLEDLRWQATAVKLDAWREWFTQQLALSSKAKAENGLYVSLRKDGRVRGSGMGRPPWAMLAAQLPPEEGIWTGLLDGMDGRV